MAKDIEQFRASVTRAVQMLDSNTIALIDTSRDLQAIVDKRHQNEVRKYRWFAVVAHSDHIYAVAEIQGKRVSLQRLIMWLEQTEKSIEEIKQVSFLNKLSFDCRAENLTGNASRLTVMQNRRPKRNTSSIYKGVTKFERPDGSSAWKTQIRGHLGTMSIGTFDCEKTAAIHYDAAAYILFENSSFYNFPEIVPDPSAFLDVKKMIARRKIWIARKQK